MPTVTAEILIILALTVLNAVFAMSEMAIVSSRRARLLQRVEGGDRGAKVALELAGSPDRFLSTVQVGITLIGILAGAFGGATLAEPLKNVLQGWPLAAPYAEGLALGIVVLVITYLSLVVGELVPKRLALAHPEPIASFVAPPIRFLSRIAAPLVAVLSASASGLLRLMGIKASSQTPVTPEEIMVMLSLGRQAGSVEASEQDLVARVFRLGERNVSSIMTPRTDMIWIDLNDPIGDSMRAMSSAGHTYFPACRGSVENVVGVVSIKAQWARMVRKQPPDLGAEVHPALYVPESMPALKLLETFKQKNRHVALAVDEYGGVSGLVTLNDVLEAIVGDIPTGDMTDSEPEATRRADGSWLLDGSITLDDLRDTLKLSETPREEGADYNTLGGFLMSHLGRIPNVTDTVEWNGWRFEIVDMDGHRVDKVLVQEPPPAPETESE